MDPAEEIRNIVLCGFMATGKSSVGKRLADLTHRSFLDLDAAIEKQEGVTIAEIFASHGEQVFRELESKMVERAAACGGQVLATGGGTIVNPRNLEMLKRNGIVIVLTANIPTILQRAGSGDNRPLLRAEDREERIRALLQDRASAYAQADVTLDTSTLSIEEVAQSLIGRLRASGFAL